MMDGLQYMHSKGIICCDVKPSNMLLDEDGKIKFCDFGPHPPATQHRGLENS